ncbi:glycosyltransferase family 4 protein [Catenovulum sediminis]|uniref:Glycosyltransferase family 4 protein n=1 Tax=Catenovulum sediminis TaxID=1740262 RepID=A0ABV1RKT1_9ALTE|nr:glycosyltransferase family 4 protein [Catenovulum sediminis]
MSKLLVIGYVWPEPDSSAAGRYMMTLLHYFLKQGYQITFASAAADSAHCYPFESLGIHKANIELNNISFDRFLEDLQPDVVLFDRFMMEEQFAWRVAKVCPQALRILDLEDLICLRKARHSALKENRSLTESDYLSDIALREIAAIYRSDLALVISKYEVKLLKEKFQLADEKLFYLPFVLPQQALNQLTPNTSVNNASVNNISVDNSAINRTASYEQRQHFVSIGSFRHEPNWDAVLQLKENIWPLIRKQLKNAELHIYGSYPPKKATQLHNAKQGFLVKGWADDALAVVSKARVCLAPLRFGAGLKGKLLEAMLTGTPNVTTNIGAEGMYDEQRDNWAGFVCNEPDDFADKAVALYTDETKWLAAQQQGYDLLNQYFVAEPFLQQLSERLAYLQDNLSQHRSRNFIGAMLQHHSMKSTQYMAQWIEAKNRLENPL